MSPNSILLAATFAVVASSSISAAPIVIDGNLDDWGLTVSDGNESNFLHPRADIGLLSYYREDQKDSGDDGYYLGPGYGGQNYDAEFMGVALQGSTLYITIVTGQRPDNGFSRYSPGDIHITTANGLYGIEVGGGKGGGDGAAITDGERGSTYRLNASGYTVGYKKTAADQYAGSLWSNVDWILDPVGPVHTQVQFAINDDSDHIGDADYIYTRDSVTGQHAVIELALDTSLFGNNMLQSIFWAPSCDNDEVGVNLQLVTSDGSLRSEQLPEPGVAALFGLGLFGMATVRLRAARRAIARTERASLQ